MKLAGAILALIAACVIGGVAVFAIVGATVKPPQPQGAICLVSHSEVVVIPIICDKDNEKDTMCDKPIVAEVCDHIEIDSP